jgi:hypothetical protein
MKRFPTGRINMLDMICVEFGLAEEKMCWTWDCQGQFVQVMRMPPEDRVSIVLARCLYVC